MKLSGDFMNEQSEYRKFTGPAEFHKSLNGLVGMLTGIASDGVVDQKEMDELVNWYGLHRHLIDRHPFNEILPIIDAALSDGTVDMEEVEDIIWLCKKYAVGGYYDFSTSVLQRLHGIIHGIMANNQLTDEEINSLLVWLKEYDYLRNTYPFEEIYSLVSSVSADGIITEDERNTLRAFFAEFIDLRESYNLNEHELNDLRARYSIQGICAYHPNIEIPNHLFCFTGASTRATRKEISTIVTSAGGKFTDSITKKVEYLVVGAEGNPCWAYSCYGRKIEKVMEMRKAGSTILIVNENDFWNVVEGVTANG